MALSLQAIFDPTRERTDASPCGHEEPTFTFYDRCANGVIGLVRENLESWFSRYPSGNDRRDLLGRLRDPDRRQWCSAIWELYIHESLLRFGFEVTPHPRLTHTARRIDFLATRGAERVFVECVTLGYADEAAARRGRVGALVAAIDRTRIFDFWLSLTIRAHGPDPIPTDVFVGELRSWVYALPIDEDARSAAGRGRMAEFTWNHEGWRIWVGATPRSPGFRGRSDMRPLAGLPVDPDKDPTWVAIRGQLEAKAPAYGELDAPFVIAVNAPGRWPDDEDEEWAVFGPYAFQSGWQRDGFLLRNDGVTYPGVSGVLVGTAIQEHSFTIRAPTLYENPACPRAVSGALGWARIQVEGDAAVHVPGIDPAEMFGLPRGWPGVPWPH